MRTKIVYCLTSNEQDYYYEQLLISVISLKKHNPDAYVEVLCDDKTYATLSGVRAEVFKYVSKITEIPLPETMGRIVRSRYLKTHARMLVKGDFLYIDTDTIICGELDFVDDFAFDVGAIKDEWLDEPIRIKGKTNAEQWINSYAKKIGVSVAGLHQYNGGVLFVKDTPKAQELYKRWSELYEKYYEKVRSDQLSLLMANNELGNVIVEMDRRLNCTVVIKKCVDHIDEAIIIHYYSGEGNYISSTRWLLEPIREDGHLTTLLQTIVDNPKDFFRQRSRVAWGRDVDFLESNLHRAFIEAPNVSHLIGKILTCYVLAKRFVLRIGSKQ